MHCLKDYKISQGIVFLMKLICDIFAGKREYIFRETLGTRDPEGQWTFKGNSQVFKVTYKGTLTHFMPLVSYYTS